MKAKKLRANLAAAQKWWDNNKSIQGSTTRPGSLKQRTGAAS